MKCRDRPTWPSGFYSAELEDSQGPGRKSAVCRSKRFKIVEKHAEFVPNNKKTTETRKFANSSVETFHEK